MHGDLEALAAGSEQVRCRYMNVVENKLVGSRCTDTHLVFLRAEGESGHALLENERGEQLLGAALCVLNGIGLCDDDVDISLFAVCDEALGAVQDPLLAVLREDCLGLDALGIRAGAGLGQTEGTELLALCERNEVLLLLLLGTEGQDRIRAQ